MYSLMGQRSDRCRRGRLRIVDAPVFYANGAKFHSPRGLGIAGNQGSHVL
ncbi:hypothetical protein RMSM_04009 [Rhodopirellula maiorica SM1]|uniref:Uncharacterized protein n=1 Tax=Rhodopirellula maiorica SM1 TaxID=1265738 RepID=M5RYR1_9BACT|nr:hypothetical protein RMSM_04009 [Rhodopirellula maiorica SM1]